MLQLNTRRFTALQIIFAGAICALLAAAVMQYRAKAQPLQYARHPESQALLDHYGPQKSSYSEEEWCIRDFFKDRRDGQRGTAQHQWQRNAEPLE